MTRDTVLALADWQMERMMYKLARGVRNRQIQGWYDPDAAWDGPDRYSSFNVFSCVYVHNHEAPR